MHTDRMLPHSRYRRLIELIFSISTTRTARTKTFIFSCHLIHFISFHFISHIYVEHEQILTVLLDGNRLIVEDNRAYDRSIMIKALLCEVETRCDVRNILIALFFVA